MMVIPNEGKDFLLSAAFRDAVPELWPWRLRLYANDYVPLATSTDADFVDAAFGGYAALVFERNTFDVPTIVDNEAVIQLPTAPTWTCTGVPTELVYGWYLATEAGYIVCAAERFAAPRHMVVGAQLTLDPFRIKLATLA